MAEELQDNDAPNEEAMDVAVDLEKKIETAMRSRIPHFKEQADSYTFEGVRRLLEKDLCLETYALDVHKRYIKQCLVKCLEEGLGEDNASKDSEETGGKSASREEAVESLEGHQPKKGVKEPCLEDEEKMEDSPVMGLLTGRKSTNVESEGIKDKDDKDILSESLITKAIKKRIPYLKAYSEEVTMAGLRRILEEDLKLTEHALDSYKKLISHQVEQILNSCEAAEQVSNEKKGSRLKTPKKVSKESSHSTEGSGSEEENDKVKPGKKNATKGRIMKSNEMKKRKGSTLEIASAKKQKKHVQRTSDDDSDAEGGQNDSEDGQSESSDKKPAKKEASVSMYGKRVDQLKLVIKSCGMSVPPSIYKKVKQAPENKRESQLVKELESLLTREGISANPSEKEIKEVKRRKERAKELEGIDLSNIVSSSRRRSTSSYVPPPPPPKPKIPVETDGDDGGDTDVGDEDDEEEEEEEDDDEEEDDNDEDNGGDDESQGEEEFNEDDNEDSD